jgi:hypothetical protein
MQTQITIKFHPIFFLIPKALTEIRCFGELKVIQAQWLCVTFEARLYKKNGSWENKN